MRLLIRTKIAIVFSLLIGLISLFIFFYFPVKLEEQAFGSIIDKARSISEFTAFSISPALVFQDTDEAEKAFKGEKNNKDIVYIVVHDENGNIFYALNIDKAKSVNFTSTHSGLIDYDTMVYKTSEPIINNGNVIGRLYLGISLHELKQNVDKSKKAIALVSFVVFSLGITVVLILSSIITKPLKQIVRTVQQIEKGDFKQRAVVKSNDEIGDLGISFNHMVDALESTYGKLEKSNQQLNESTQQLEMEIEGHKITESALRDSEVRFRTFMETASDLMYMADHKGNFIYANESMIRTLGYTNEEMIGMNYNQILKKENLLLSLKPTMNEIDANEQDSHDAVWITKEGKEIIGEIRVTSINDSAGNITGSRGVFRDITERKQLEDERSKLSKLESIGLLAGGIAHDFNNILTAILGNIALAKYEIDKKDKVLTLLKDGEIACLRAKDITHQLLTFSRGGAPIKETIDLRQLINDTARFTLSGSSIKFYTAISQDIWTTDVDKGQISQAISNLIINAQQAMTKSGNIIITGKNFTVTSEDKLPLQNGKYVKLTVTDNGKGIIKKNLSKIFDPYFSTKDKGGGLGLTTTFSIIKKHNGHISVESHCGVGTTFYIYLPASQNQVEAKELPKESPQLPKESPQLPKESPQLPKESPQLIKGKILIMDDEPDIRKLICETVTLHGCVTAEACNGSDAIDLYVEAMESENPFDVIIMDLTIPGGMGGKEAMRRLRKLDPEVKAIVSSGYADDPVLSNYEKYGFKEKIPKPIDFDELISVLNKVVVTTD